MLPTLTITLLSKRFVPPGLMAPPTVWMLPVGYWKPSNWVVPVNFTSDHPLKPRVPWAVTFPRVAEALVGPMTSTRLPSTVAFAAWVRVGAMD
jgi:hypothetical protein